MQAAAQAAVPASTGGLIHMSDDPLELIETAADVFDVDLQEAVCGVDRDGDSSRIYILEAVEGGYRLVEFGLTGGYPESGQPASEEPMFIPDTALQDVGAMFHAASLHQTHNVMAQEDGGPELSLRDVSDSFDLSHPLRKDVRPDPDGDQ